MPGRSTAGDSLVRFAGSSASGPFDQQRVPGGFGRQIRERDRRLAALFAPQARPEGGVDDAFDRGGVGDFGLEPRALDVRRNAVRR